jgi:hypothetical protein
METLTRLVSESLARHGFDRPVDYRRLQWSRWFRCESHHSLLSVPSKPGVFALAEEIVEFDGSGDDKTQKLEGQSGRMLAVTQFFEDDDMAFVLDRMLSQQNPMRVQLNSGRYFVRFVVIEDSSQRHSICAALNQWIASSAERVTGIGAHFASSPEVAEHNMTLKSPLANAETTASLNGVMDKSVVNAAVPPSVSTVTAPQIDSGAATNIHCPSPFPSGF